MGAVKLRVFKSGEELQVLNLADFSKSSVVLGRSDDADICMNDRAVGRNHAVITLGGAGGAAGASLSVQKKSEFGKMQVNGSEVNESQLKPGDVISIADYQIRLEQEAKQTSNTAHPDLAAMPQENTPPQGTNLNVASDLPEGIQSNDEIPTNGFEQPQEQFQEQLQDQAGGFVETEKTSMVSMANLAVKLTFKPGEANVEEFEIKKPEISIGRGSSCDVVIEDKKSSRKQVTIRKVGGAYLIKDLDSANGTFVNGIKITEQELSGDDVIKIGSTEFVFKALNKEYLNQEQQGDFLVVPPDAPEDDLDSNAVDAAVVDASYDMSLAQAPTNPGLESVDAIIRGMPVTGQVDPNLGIAGLSATSGAPQKKSLVAKFMALPPKKRLIYGGVILVFIIGIMDFLNEQDAAQQAALAKKKTEQTQPKDPSQQAFNQLPKEKQEFIVQTYALALDLYTKKNYEQALFEINKIGEILPNFSYKDSKDIAEYARRGLEMIRAQQEEQKKREDEEKRKQKITELVASAQELFDKSMEAEAKEIFSRILELDPDNPTVAHIKATIEERDSKKRLEEEQRRQIEQMKRLMTDVINAGQDLLKEAKYYEAIDKFLEVPGVGTDAQLIAKARELIAAAKKELADKRQPHLDAAKSAYENKEYEKSRDEYHQALAIDPRCEDCRQGIARIKHDVHERAQKIYIEAIIAESVSDLTVAKKKYLECYQASVPEDDYYGRCWRKYHRFITLESQQDNATALTGEDAKGVRAPAESLRDMDPYTQEVLKSL